MKVIITESQYKKVLIREFGEMEDDPKKWYRKILKWVEGDRSRLKFDNNEYETVVYDDKGFVIIISQSKKIIKIHLQSLGYVVK